MDSSQIDSCLRHLSNEDELKRIYKKYRMEKLDKLLAEGIPRRGERVNASENPNSLDELFADFPIHEYATVHDLSGRPRRKRLISIPTGTDGIDYTTFEKEFDRNIAAISRKLNSGKYTFHPMREIITLKDPLPNGRRPNRSDIQEAVEKDRARVLSIASIRDAVVQRVLYEAIEPIAESLFRTLDIRTPSKHKPVSYAYRRGKSPGKAARAVYECMRAGFVHVLDADLRKFFDTIPHEALLAKAAELIGAESRIFQLIRRFIHSDRVEYLSYHWARDGKGHRVGETIFKFRKPVFYAGEVKRDIPRRLPRTAGVPQGGVLSGVLANVYLHTFDVWVVTDLANQFPLRYVRYADDFVILAKSETDLSAIYLEVLKQLNDPPEQGGLGLHMHEYSHADPKSKTQLVDASKCPIRFVGFEISSTRLRIHPEKIARYKQRWLDAVQSEQHWRELLPDPNARLERLICRRLKYKIHGRVAIENCRRCGQELERRRSWIAYFSTSSDWRQIRSLERWMRRQIYKQFRSELPGLTFGLLRQLRYPSIFREYWRVRVSPRGCPNCAVQVGQSTPSTTIHQQSRSEEL